jgi:putative FmdB family regulatory protein
MLQPGAVEAMLGAMPLYEFACQDCGARTDVRASVRDLEDGLDARCSACGGSSLRRLLKHRRPD